TGLLGAEHDEQIFNGATFTNWGYGVPLLEAPFHALASLTNHGRYFPDRLIFVLYLSALTPILWTSVQRALVKFARGIDTWVFSWCVTLAILSQSLFTLLSYRFIQYEQTVAYLVLAELLALACYLRCLDKPRTGWVVAMGAAAGLGLLVRVTG